MKSLWENTYQTWYHRIYNLVYLHVALLLSTLLSSFFFVSILFFYLVAMADKAKPFTCTNIKSYVPLILDLNELNYDVCRELFLTHCRAYGVHDYLDGTTTSKGPTDVDWDNLDNLVKSWLYGTMTQSLLTMIFHPKSTAQSIWDDLETLFRDNKHSRAIELDNELHSLVQGD